MSDYHQRELEALYKLKSFLENYRVDLGTQIGQYISWVRNLQEEKGLAKTISICESNCADNENLIERVIKNIDDTDLPFVISEIRKIEDRMHS